eukprot:scaffold196547_cov50-Attheya_sp.AAC.1
MVLMKHGVTTYPAKPIHPPFLLNSHTSLPTPTVGTHEGAIPISCTVMKLSLIVVLPALMMEASSRCCWINEATVQ